MKHIRFIILSVSLSVILSINGCYSPPEFPVVPQISLEEVIFVDFSDPFESDSLIVKINFQDGDGDLGLSESETFAPYNDKAYFAYFADQNRLIKFSPDTLSQSEDQIFFENRINYRSRSSPPLDTLPSFVDPYSCINWDIISNAETNFIDTLYYQRNENHHNILIDFLIEQPGGGYREFDLRKEFGFPNCGISYDGRFPILQRDGSSRPLEGTIRYGMTSVLFKSTFSIRNIKLRIQIIDRSLNSSNVIETPPFTLGSITVPGNG